MIVSATLESRVSGEEAKYLLHTVYVRKVFPIPERQPFRLGGNRMVLHI